MLNKVTGWCAVLLSLMAFYPSNMTGGLSCIGFYIACSQCLSEPMQAVLANISILFWFFFFSLINIFVINDGTNVFLFSQQNDWVYVLSMYGIFAVVSVVCFGLLRKETLLAQLDAVN
ncbi:hypothetical protein [Pseudoalteromonas phenolica]|uniref:hypothetical protein n=1 Tax=Pseudoalteromonas phenolica TaxID=161398 RepID=UPI001F4F8577|nr:hypothetical protein [Pseudoalteromonas phenolica]